MKEFLIGGLFGLLAIMTYNVIQPREVGLTADEIFGIVAPLQECGTDYRCKTLVIDNAIALKAER